MKTIKILILAFLLSSCAARMGPNEYVEVYRYLRPGEQMPCYLTLRPYDKTFDTFSTMGHFEIKGDTLCLLPKYEYGSRIKEIGSKVSAGTVPEFYIIKGNRLIEITDYEIYPELAPWFDENTHFPDYTRVAPRKKR